MPVFRNIVLSDSPGDMPNNSYRYNCSAIPLLILRNATDRVVARPSLPYKFRNQLPLSQAEEFLGTNYSTQKIQCGPRQYSDS
jgi:hypothetical protein